MARFSLFLIGLVPVSAFAQSYERPIPQAQSATAEFWFLMASLTLIAALGAVGWLIKNR
ncbi:MAG: protein NnrT [Rhodobacteraceae bacterium]|nr:protein NnrT [Paracoccaceae bacterium]